MMDIQIILFERPFYVSSSGAEGPKIHRSGFEELPAHQILFAKALNHKLEYGFYPIRRQFKIVLEDSTNSPLFPGPKRSSIQS